MSLARVLVVCLSLAAVPQAWAQKWEFGGSVGGGFYPSADITNPHFGSAAANIKSNLVGSVYLSNETGGKWGGELRYDYQVGDLQLKQGSANASFGAHSQAVHYDVQYHFTSVEARVRPFVAFGGGVKFYQGTGNEVVFQPLSGIALLTKTRNLVGMGVAGGGVKVRLMPHLQLRLEVHDYITPFPDQVFTPNAGSKAPWLLQDIVPSAGLGYVF